MFNYRKMTSLQGTKAPHLALTSFDNIKQGVKGTILKIANALAVLPEQSLVNNDEIVQQNAFKTFCTHRQSTHGAVQIIAPYPSKN